jgi:hypothetical protein
MLVKQHRQADLIFTEYNSFSQEQVHLPTSSFSRNLVMLKESYGTVYKAKFQHKNATVKVSKLPSRQWNSATTARGTMFYLFL